MGEEEFVILQTERFSWSAMRELVVGRGGIWLGIFYREMELPCPEEERGHVISLSGMTDMIKSFQGGRNCVCLCCSVCHATLCRAIHPFM